jgi:hypothetical protein
MKRFLVLISALFLWQAHTSAQVSTQSQPHPPRCGLDKMKAAMIAKDPTWADRFAAQKASLQGIAENYIARKQQEGIAERTTATVSAVPIIFHIVVDSAQFNLLGGTAGIMVRCDSQIAVLNRDYNRENTDSTKIPSSWKSLYGTPGIKFGLARIDPNGDCSPGYEIKIISGNSTTDAGFDDVDNSFPEAKTASTGLAAWDVTKYYNVWCINFSGNAQGLLGLTVPLSFTKGNNAYPADEEGVCMLYNTLGCTAANGTPPANTGGSNGWFYPYNLGRTLTHETGHFFEIWHPWGDDGPDNYNPGQNGYGYCPWNGVTPCSPNDSAYGSDDGLSDTPPESQSEYGNPTYTIAGGTLNDCCNMHGTVNEQPIGIACLSYMDYTDDDAMHMFTTMQAAAMASMVLVPATNTTGADGSGKVGENYGLTQHPNLLVCDSTVTTTGVNTPAAVSSALNIFPNPTTGQITITLNSSAETLNQIMVVNILGQTVMNVNGQNKDYYSINLSGMSKGIYFIKCNFASGSVTRKILLQ